MTAHPFQQLKSTDDSHLTGQFQTLKDVGDDMLNKGVFTLPTARQYLKQKLAKWIGDRQNSRTPTRNHVPQREPRQS